MLSSEKRAREMIFGRRRTALGEKRRRGPRQPRTDMTIQEIINDKDVREEARERAELDRRRFPND